MKGAKELLKEKDGLSFGSWQTWRLKCPKRTYHCHDILQFKISEAVKKYIYIYIYTHEGCSESKECLCIQPAQLFHCTRSVIWCVQ
jgi:hypothetical protein